MLKTMQLAAKLLWREWRGGEWYVVFLALIIAISAITGLDFYVDRMIRGLDQQSAKFLGGDLVISSSTPIPILWKQTAEKLTLRSAEVWTFSSVVSTNTKMQLVNIQAVSNNYPLMTENSLNLEPDTVWVEPRLLPLMSLSINNQINIGMTSFRIARLLTPEIDALNTGWMISPRVLMRLEDVPKTHVVLPGSRVNYRLLLVGDKKNLKQFQQWILPQLNSSQRLLTVRNQQILLKDVLQNTENYLQLVLLICIFMSGVAIALSTQQYLRRHYAHVALWRCLGAKARDICYIFLCQLFIIAFIAGLIGIILGYLAQSIFAHLFDDVLKFSLPPPGFSPLVIGFLVSCILLFSFSYPIISVLPKISPLYVWRNEIWVEDTRRQYFFYIAFFLLLVFLYGFTDFSLLTLLLVNAVLINIGLLCLLSIVILSWIRKIVIHTDGPLRRGLSELTHHPDSVSLQFIGFTLILMLIIISGLLRSDLIKNWQLSLPASTPNFFAINISPADINKFQLFFQNNQITIEGVYPVARGRLVGLNSKPILLAIPEYMRKHNALHRELNLSWMWELPSDNKILAGNLWSKQDVGKPLVSVEKAFAEDLHLKIGDLLTFQIGNQNFTAVIKNFRSLNWSSFHPNFYMIFVPGLLENFPYTYVTSFYLKENQYNLLNSLIKVFPSITIIDVAMILQQLQDITKKITYAFQYLFLFALGSGVLIFITSLQASLDERKTTYHLLHVLGASKKYINKSILVEFSCLAGMIVICAVSLGYLVTYLLEKQIFNI